MLGYIKLWLGRRLANYLSTPIKRYRPFSVHDVSTLESTLRPADILLVEGNTRISTAIKYLTQSTWSHTAMYVGEIPDYRVNGEACHLVEADLKQGVIGVPVSKYRSFNTRICRAVDLDREDEQAVVRFMTDSLGKSYDLKNVTDLMRYLLPTPPVPVRWRRRLIALGSGDPSRAICSTLIAQAFQAVHYPILPTIEKTTRIEDYGYTEAELLHIRHYSLFSPRDFDISPYFRVVKPTIESGFDYRSLNWSHKQ